MNRKPTYDELTARVRELEASVRELSHADGFRTQTSDPDIIRTLSESFQQLADRSQDAIYLFDIESGTFPFFNKRFLSLFGGREAGRTILSSASVAQHIHPEDVQKLRDARQRTLAAGETQGDVEYRYIGSDGTFRWMHDRWTVVRDSENRAVAIEGFVRDNTQKKQAEAELEHSRNSALIGSYIVQGGRFRYVNPEFCRITGYPREQLTGMLSLDLVHPDYRAHVRDCAKQMLTGQRTTPYEFRVVDGTGRVKWVMETVTAVKHEGARAVLGYFMDITQQKQTAEDLRDKEKLRAILEMAGAVSHELNNPLQVVLIGIRKLEDATLEPAQKADLIQLVKKHTLRIMELSSKIQRISKYATKDYVQGKKIVDIDAAANKK
jgi:PAS domain S-box-containing protein